MNTLIESFIETALSSKEAFYSQISQNHIKHDEYKHSQNVWNTFRCYTFGNYCDIYLKTDVLLLAGVFEKFRDNSIRHYSLDPAHYFSSPGISWDPMEYPWYQKDMLKPTIQSQQSQHPDYDSSMSNIWLLYLNANDLYGWAMEQFLPVGEFQLVEPEPGTIRIDIDEILAPDVVIK